MPERDLTTTATKTVNTNETPTATGVGPVEWEITSASMPVVPGYEIIELIGRGGMGKVYRARNLALGRNVAIKVLAAEPDERSLARFRDESRAVARLQHPNIASLFECGIAEGKPFFSQEFVEGGTLAKKFAGIPQDHVQAATLVETIARAIDYSHQQGIIHRDLKPGNILLTADGTPKVTDFGLAKELPGTTGSTSESAAITRTGEIVGTPAYMPPEQASGVVSGLGPEVDVYSLGAILYEALTGRPPFHGPDSLQTLLMVLSMDPVAPRSLLPKIPRDLETICLKCLEKSPKRRYHSANELAEDLRRFRMGEPIVARQVSSTERAIKWTRRNPWPTIAIASIAIGIVGLIAGLLWIGEKNREISITNHQLMTANKDLEQSNDQLDRARSDAEAMLRSSLASLDEYHFDLSEKLRELPQGEHLRLEVLQKARATIDHLYDLGPKKTIVWEYLMDAYSRLARAQTQIGDFERAIVSYQRVRSAASRLGLEHPEEPIYEINHATAGYELAIILERLGRQESVAGLRSEAAATANRLSVTAQKRPELLKLRLFLATDTLYEAASGGTWESIDASYRNIISLYSQLAEAEPNNSKHSTSGIEWKLKLVGSLTVQMKLPQAETLLSEIEPEIAKLAGSTTASSHLLRASYYQARAGIHEAHRQPNDADHEYRRALAEYESLVNAFPNTPNYRRWIVSTWTSMGNNWRFAGKISEAIGCFEKAREVALDLTRRQPEDLWQKEMLEKVEKYLRDVTPKPK